MDTLQIALCLKKNKHTRKIFRGVFPLDRLSTFEMKIPSLVVVNTAISSQPGKHWVAIYLPKSKRTIEFFDSYGRFLQNKYFNTFYKKNIQSKAIFNKKIIQSAFSNVCGQYCCVYAVYRARKLSLNKFVGLFSPIHLIENDRKIVDLFHKYF